MRLKPEDAKQVYTGIELVKKNFRTLETLGVPVVKAGGRRPLGFFGRLALGEEGAGSASTRSLARDAPARAE